MNKLSIIFLLTALLSLFGIELEIEPYLLNVNENSAEVCFRLSDDSEAELYLWSSLDTVKVNSKNSQFHIIKAEGLDQGSLYYYKIIAGRDNFKSEFYYFRTSAADGESFTFAVFGDTRPGESANTKIHSDIIEQISRISPSFVLLLGDMVDDGRNINEWIDFFNIESDVLSRTGFFPVLGDNDFMSGKGIYESFFPFLKQKYYSFKWGNVWFFGLFAYDSSGTQPESDFNSESDQLKWLKDELSRKEVSEASFRVVFIHDPVIISRGYSSDVLKKSLVPVFEQYNVDIVFSSEHLYERSNLNGVTYIISGGAGAELIWRDKKNNYSVKDARKHHFCRIDATPNSLNLKAVDINGTVIDEIMLTPKNNSSIQDESFIRLSEKLIKEKLVFNDKNNSEALNIIIFSTDCSYCAKLINGFLPSISKKKDIQINADVYSLKDYGVYELMLIAGERLGKQKFEIPAVISGKNIYGGKKDIESGIEAEIIEFKKDPELYKSEQIDPFGKKMPAQDLKKKRFLELNYGFIITAGLIDGINPCAFTAIIFLLSYLAISGFGKKRMIQAGIFFTLGVYVSYFISGLLFHSFISSLVNPFLQMFINIILLVAVTVFAFISLSDAYYILKKESKKVVLQLPDKIKNGIRKRIRYFAKNYRYVSLSSFILGYVISVMELVCTGQVYLPIVGMISDPDTRVSAISYLSVYNLAFITPLIFVFVFTAAGVSYKSITVYFGKYAFYTKVFMSILFFSMSVLIMINMGWVSF